MARSRLPLQQRQDKPFRGDLDRFPKDDLGHPTANLSHRWLIRNLTPIIASSVFSMAAAVVGESLTPAVLTRIRPCRRCK
ncbi:MAG: hypothetical protein R3E79_22410 [Caldilineaceae bacterium]